MLRFAAVGLDHGHIFDHVNGLLAAGAELSGYCPETSVPGVLEQFRKSYPNARVLQRDAIFDDPTIDVICSAAIPRDPWTCVAGDAEHQARIDAALAEVPVTEGGYKRHFELLHEAPMNGYKPS